MGNLQNEPVVQAEMLIRRPAEDVYEAFVDPAITTRFWFTRSSGRLVEGQRVRWDWEMYGVGDDVEVLALEPARRIHIRWSDGTEVEWTFTPRGERETFVAIRNSGFTGDADDKVAAALDSMGGYTMVLCGAKAYLEHGIELNLVADKAPDAHVPSAETRQPREQRGTPILNRLEHMQIPVRRMDDAIAWYTEHLGFRLQGKAEDDRHAFLTLPEGPMLMLWETEDDTSATFSVNDERMPVLLYNTDHIHHLHDRLQALGAQITFYKDEGFGWVLKFNDPSGNLWGAIQLNG